MANSLTMANTTQTKTSVETELSKGVKQTVTVSETISRSKTEEVQFRQIQVVKATLQDCLTCTQNSNPADLVKSCRQLQNLATMIEKVAFHLDDIDFKSDVHPLEVAKQHRLSLSSVLCFTNWVNVKKVAQKYIDDVDMHGLNMESFLGEVLQDKLVLEALPCRKLLEHAPIWPELLTDLFKHGHIRQNTIGTVQFRFQVDPGNVPKCLWGTPLTCHSFPVHSFYLEPTLKAKVLGKMQHNIQEVLALAQF